VHVQLTPGAQDGAAPSRVWTDAGDGRVDGALELDRQVTGREVCRAADTADVEIVARRASHVDVAEDHEVSRSEASALNRHRPSGSA
jgi:hypothetical protein